MQRSVRLCKRRGSAGAPAHLAADLGRSEWLSIIQSERRNEESGAWLGVDISAHLIRPDFEGRAYFRTIDIEERV